MEESQLRASVVVATYNRGPLLCRLLRQLAAQTLDVAAYEVVVVDDGSREPAAAQVEALALPCAVRVARQANAGAAVARHHAITLARGEVVIIVDDDMQVESDFIEAHLRAHPPGSRRAALGAIRADPAGPMALFERWHQRNLDRFAAGAEAGARLRGFMLYTGNLSLHRADYLAVGGFDASLGRSEDSELGIRLEEAGVEIVFAPGAATLNGSDHTSVTRWRRSAVRYGAFDAYIARKHPELPEASPWRYLAMIPRASAPVLIGQSFVPALSWSLGTLTYLGAVLGWRLGMKGPALSAAGLVYAIDYFRGLRREMGGVAMLKDLKAYRSGQQDPGAGAGAAAAAPATRRRGPFRRFWSAVRADHDMLMMYHRKYGKTNAHGNLLLDTIQKVGMQMMVAIRFMRLLRDLRIPLAAQVQCRLIRHVYGSDIHPDVEFEPGVVIAHGFAMAMAPGVKIGAGCILSHAVSIGLGNDPVTRQGGAPVLERTVHVGPGAVLLGPITIGEGSKIQAGALVTQSVPPYSLVMAPQPEVKARASHAATAGEGT